MSVSVVRAHEMVPTYPEMKPSFMDGLQKLTMTMFNKREEVEYYEIGVFTTEWEPVPFVSNYKVFRIPYLSTVTFDIYVRDEDKHKAEFICSQSKLRKKQLTRTAVSSRICSRVKK
jgi:hypothetical protein